MESDLIVDKLEILASRSAPVSTPPKDNSFLYQYIENNVSSDYSISSLLTEIYEMHIKNKKNYYLYPRSVIIPKKANDLNLNEKIQLIKNLLSKIFSPADIESLANGTFKINQLQQWPRYLLFVTFQHFHKLINDPNVYSTLDEQEQLTKVFIKSLTQNDSRFTLSLSLPLSSSKQVNFLNTQAEQQNNTYEKVRDSNDVKKADYKVPLINYFDQTMSQTELIISSLKLYPQIINISQAKSIAQMISQGNVSFVHDFIKVLPTALSEIHKYFDDITTVYESNQSILKVLKYLALCELNRTGKSNEMFRQNNNFIRCILHYITEECKDFIAECVPKLNKIVIDAKPWSIDNPSDEDVQTVVKLLSDFWALFTESVDKIPGSVRLLLRCIRHNSEFMFRTSELNNRACFAIFLLRFLFIQMSDPMQSGMKTKDIARIIQFTKLFAFAGQMSTIKVDQKPEKLKLNPALESSFPDGEKFYNKLTSTAELEKKNISDDKLVAAVQSLKDYILKNEQAFLDEAKNNANNQNYFAVEGVCDFILYD